LQGLEDLAIQQIVQQFAVKNFHVTVFLRASRLNESVFTRIYPSQVLTTRSVNSGQLSLRLNSGTSRVTNSQTKHSRASLLECYRATTIAMGMDGLPPTLGFASLF
jgi:hypothetical protein